MRYFWCLHCSSLVVYGRCSCGQRAVTVAMEEPNLFTRYPVPDLPESWRTRTKTLSIGSVK